MKFSFGFDFDGVGSPAVFTPAANPNLVLWLKANTIGVADGAAVTAWADQSGAGHNLVQSTGTSQPAYRTTGGPLSKPCVDFDGSSDFLDFSAAWNQVVPFTVYVVAKTEATGTKVFMDRNGAGTAPAIYFALGGTNAALYWNGTTIVNNVASPNAWHIFRFRLTSSTGGLRLNNGAESTGSHSQSALAQWSRMFAFSAALQQYDGQIAEVILVHESISAPNDALIMAYLNREHGL